MARTNSFSFEGRIGAAIELRVTANGRELARFPLYTDAAYVKDGERIDRAYRHQITVWSTLATMAAQQLAVGDLVRVDGHVEQSSYQTIGGETVYTTSFVAGAIYRKLQPEASEMGDAEPAPEHGPEPVTIAESPAPGRSRRSRRAAAQPELDEDLPF